MSLRNGAYLCDRCGVDVGNGGVQEAAFISRLNPEDLTEAERLHLCIAPREGAPRGCNGTVLGPGTLASYTEAKDSRDE